MSREMMEKAPSVAQSLGIIVEDFGMEPETEIPIEFRKGEIETVEKVLDRIDQVAAKRVSEGFNKKNFQLGVLNYLIMSFVFGKYPQHFWLVVLVELSVLIPMKMIGSYNAKPLCQILYFADLCWVLNLFGIFVNICLFIDMVTTQKLISDQLRYDLFVTVYGISCGPLLGATILLPFVAVVFHDYVIMTGLFIHILPPMVMYTFRWNFKEIQQAWPQFYKLSYMDNLKFFPDGKWFFLPGTGLGTVAGNTIAVYFLWFIPYLFWMLLVGMNLPRKNRKNKDGTVIVPVYDTVFHSTVRTGLTAVAGKVFWGRPSEISKAQMENDDYETRDFLVYICVHAILACSSVYILAFPCYLNQTVHTVMLIFLTVICVARGAARYTYYVTEMYQHAIRKDFAALLMDAKKNK